MKRFVVLASALTVLTVNGGIDRLKTNAPEGETRDLKVGLWAFPMATDGLISSSTASMRTSCAISAPKTA